MSKRKTKMRGASTPLEFKQESVRQVKGGQSVPVTGKILWRAVADVGQQGTAERERPTQGRQ
jgi:hypothetical protein